jgi:phospholipase/carboxylesterase
VRVVPAAEPPAEATLIMLHGYGASAADIEPVARALGRSDPHLAVLVPDGCDPFEAGPEGRQWWGMRDTTPGDRAARLHTAAVRVERMVEAEIARQGLPRDRRAWAGFSQGAMLAEWMAVHAAPRPAAVVAFSGLFADDAPAGPPVGTPVLLVHGTRDTRIPFAAAEHAERELRARGAVVERLDRAGMGHSIDEASLSAAVAFLGRHLAAR